MSLRNPQPKKPRKRIVAEISKNWPEVSSPGMPRLLAERFEQVISINAERGFQLESWQLSTVVVNESSQGVKGSGPTQSMVESIIAVFVELAPPRPSVGVGGAGT